MGGQVVRLSLPLMTTWQGLGVSGTRAVVLPGVPPPPPPSRGRGVGSVYWRTEKVPHLVASGPVHRRLCPDVRRYSRLPLIQASTESATSRQPWSIVSEWPRSWNSLISVTAEDLRYCR